MSNVQFVFTALALTDSMRMQFKYQLEGIDRTWVDGGTTRQASYTNLGPGGYRFLVTASNGEGAWSEPTVPGVRHTARRSIRTATVLDALCALGVVTMMWAVWQLNARRVRKRFALVLARAHPHEPYDPRHAAAGVRRPRAPARRSGARSRGRTRRAGERLRRIRRRVEDDIREARQSISDLRSPVLERLTFPDVLREVGSRVIADRPVSLDITYQGRAAALFLR